MVIEGNYQDCFVNSVIWRSYYQTGMRNNLFSSFVLCFFLKCILLSAVSEFFPCVNLLY